MQNVTINNPNYNKIGATTDGRLLYEVKDVTSGNYQNYTVAQENADKYESLINSTHKDFAPMKIAKQSHLATISGSIAGAGIAAYLTRKSSTTKKVIGTIGGCIGGILTAATITALILISKFAKNIKQAKNLDLRKYNEENPPEQKVSEQTV